ncbi:hypothetical protein [Rhizobium mesosinicum]|uniref:Uncharacterized protein n=1 Tax=Rhizobium mesosinicum TaxID=335017 RepID=A0ABS7GNA9_9HYPH|nr:hypothetical protein [Rhizobium mesosinicum]MBW9051425.1 hypothetical protein [Rhizobium mesosinicum]
MLKSEIAIDVEIRRRCKHPSMADQDHVHAIAIIELVQQIIPDHERQAPGNLQAAVHRFPD